MNRPCVQSVMCTLGFPGVCEQNSRRSDWCLVSGWTQAEHPQRGSGTGEDLVYTDACFAVDSERGDRVRRVYTLSLLVLSPWI